MATVLFFILPEMGHMNSTFKLSRRLIARGHHVCYAQIPDLEAHLRAQGFDVVPFLASIFPAGFMNQHMRVDLEAVLMEKAATTNLDLNIFGQEISSVVSQIRPDLLILDFLLPNIGAIVEVVKQMGVPFFLFRNILSVTPEYAAFEAHHHLLVPCPTEFDFPRAEPIRKHHYVEASIDLERTEPAFPEDQIREQTPLIYCSLGTQSHLFEDGVSLRQRVIDALASKPDWQMILSIGTDLKLNDFHAVPPHVMLVNRAPQLKILQRAAVMITHGGLNTIKECIYFGVPMIVFPLGRDQYLNAARVEYHHLGVRATGNSVSAEQICALIEQVAGDQTIKERVMAMSKVFREKEETAQSVKVIEAFLDHELEKHGVA